MCRITGPTQKKSLTGRKGQSRKKKMESHPLKTQERESKPTNHLGKPHKTKRPGKGAGGGILKNPVNQGKNSHQKGKLGEVSNQKFQAEKRDEETENFSYPP